MDLLHEKLLTLLKGRFRRRVAWAQDLLWEELLKEEPSLKLLNAKWPIEELLEDELIWQGRLEPRAALGGWRNCCGEDLLKLHMMDTYEAPTL